MFHFFKIKLISLLLRFIVNKGHLVKSFRQTKINKLMFRIFLKFWAWNKGLKFYNYLKWSNILSFISLIFLIITFYVFVLGINFRDLYFIIFSFIISFLVSNFILNKFKYSNNFYIRIIQRIFIYSILFIILVVSLWLYGIYNFNEVYCSDGSEDIDLSDKGKEVLSVTEIQSSKDDPYYNIKADKKMVDKLLSAGSDLVAKGLETVVPSIASGSAAGAAAATAVKVSAHLPPLQRLGAVGSVAGVTAFTTKVGLDAGVAVGKNLDIKNMIKNSAHADPSVDKIPSPSDTPSVDFIPSVLGDENIPLVEILRALFTFNLLELLLIIFLIFFICNKYIYRFNFKFISNLINKYKLNKYKWLSNISEKGINYNDKFSNFMIVIILIILVILKLLEIIFSYELYKNIDDYVLVYNHIKKNSIIFFTVTGYNTIINKKIINKYKHSFFITMYNILKKKKKKKLENITKIINRKINSLSYDNKKKKKKLENITKIINRKINTLSIDNISNKENIEQSSENIITKEILKNNFLDSNKKNNINILNSIKKIFEDKNFNENIQRKIENFLYENSQFNIKSENNIYNELGKSSQKLKDIFFESNQDLLIFINNFKNNEIIRKKSLRNKNNAKYLFNIMLKESDSDFIVSFLLAQVVFIMNNHIEEKNYCVNFYSKVGKGLVKHYYYRLYQKKKSICNKTNYSLSDWKTENIDIINEFNEIVIITIGSFVMEWLTELDLIEIKYIETSDYENFKQIQVYDITTQLKKEFKKVKIFNAPEKIPMIIKPLNYERKIRKDGIVEEIYGGYLLNHEMFNNDLIIQNWRNQEKSKIENINIVYKAINNMSSVAFKINKDVLNFIRRYDFDFNLCLKSDEKIDNILSKLKDNKKLDKWEKDELESYNSKKELQENIFLLADLYEDIPEFFIPLRMDYRGRIYCISDYLNYQGNELAKSLLLFSKAEKIIKTDEDSINYLRIFGANCFGNKLDKCSFTDRIKWVNDNLSDIQDFYNGKLLNKAESKFLFIAFCFEFNRWLDCLKDHNSTHFYTSLPIQLDATCNGYQHLAMLGLNSNLANNLNLNRINKNDKPQDLYTFLASFLNNYFDNKLKQIDLSEKKNEKEKNSLLRLKNLSLKRKIIKKTIMTIPYNVSSVQSIKNLKESFIFDKEYTDIKNKNGLKIFIEENPHLDPKLYKNQVWFKYREDFNIKLESLDFINLFHGLTFVIHDVFPSLKLLTDYLKEIANICSILGLTIPWTLPTGLVANQSYVKLKDVRIKPLAFGENTFTLKVKSIEELDKGKQIRAFMPNLIHSLDATSLILLINLYFTNYDSEHKNIYAVHDCFAVTCKNMEYIIESLKNVYISLYSDKGYLTKLNNEIINHIKSHIGDDFDLNTLTIRLSNKKKTIQFPNIDNVLKEKYDIALLKYSSYIIN